MLRAARLIAALMIGLPLAALAETPWEAYLRAPTPARASAVTSATYSSNAVPNGRLEADLRVLEHETSAGDASSIALAVRLMAQLESSAALAEYLEAILGRAIRPNPRAYLESISATARCPGAAPSGDFFVDRPEARVAEAEARISALGTVRTGALRRKRDECISALKKTL